MRLRNILDALHQIGWVIVGTRPVRVPSILIVLKIIHVIKVAFLWPASAPRDRNGQGVLCSIGYLLYFQVLPSRSVHLGHFVSGSLFETHCSKELETGCKWRFLLPPRDRLRGWARVVATGTDGF